MTPSAIARHARIFLLSCALSGATLAQADPGGMPAPAEPDAIETKAAACFACHGPLGNSNDGNYPILAGQNARYLYLQLRDFKEGRRKNALMSPMAAGLSKPDMQQLAAYFAGQKMRPTSFQPEPAKVALGKQKSDETLCPMCHLGGFVGQNEIPKVAGQHPQYVIAQLNAFRSHLRTNDAGNMSSVSKTLNDQDIENLANYIASLY